MKRYLLLILTLIFSLNLSAGKIEKAFKALDVYNYFEAKRLFEKSLKSDCVAANYGLSIIYLRDDNPFFNLDSAHSTIIHAADHYSALPEKTKLQYQEIKVDSLRIFEHRSKVANALYKRAKRIHTVGAYQWFLDENPWSVHVDSVIFYRDRLSFAQAEEQNTSEAFAKFIKTYPDSHLRTDAQSTFDRLNYQEQTAPNNFIDYVSFVRNFPESPYRADAEDQIYKIYTKTGSLEAYKNFIDNYPENRNVPTAWKKMFNTYLENDYSSSSIQAFLEEFEDYPFKEELLAQLDRVERTLYPIKVRNKWGYIDLTGDFYISPAYEIAEPFYEGLAIVSIDGKFGFVDKTGELVIDAIFDDAYRMSEGHAVVELSEKWGLINRTGEFVIEPLYEDLGNLNEGLSYFALEELYGYFDLKGIVRLKAQYETADDFSGGKAIVSNQGGYGLIDVFGTTTIPFKYQRLKTYGEGTYLAKFNGLWGIIKENGDSLVPFKYEFIGEMNNNRAIVSNGDSFNYIDQNGNEILTEWIETYPEYRQLAAFTRNHAKILFDKGYNLIDTNGRKLFTRDKDDIGNYGSYIAVKKGDKWGYVNNRGSLVIGYNFTSAGSFDGKWAKAGGAPLTGVIGKNGLYQIEPYFEQINFFNDTVMITKSRGNYGLLLTSGDTLIDFKYVSIEPFSEQVVRLESKENIYYYQLEQNVFIRKEEE